MPEQDSKLKRLENLLNAVDDTVTKDEFVQAFEEVIKLVEDIKSTNNKEFNAMHDFMMRFSGKLHGDTSQTLSDLKGQVNGLFVGDKVAAMQTEHTQRMKEVDTKLASIRNGKDSIVPGPQGIPGKAGSPDSAKQVRNKLEVLKGEDRLDISAIKGLDEWKVGVEKTAGKTLIVPTGGASGGGIVKAYDLSSSLNGVLKTFSLPAFWRVIDVKLSSTPVLQLTTDYTIDGSNMQITFTSNISASTQLATGQYLLVIYAET